MKMSGVKPSLYLLSLSLSTLVERLNVIRCEYDLVNSRVVVCVRDIGDAENALQVSANYAHEIDVDGVLIREDGGR